MTHVRLDSLAREYAKGEYREFYRQINLPKDKRSSVEDDPTIPWRYAVSYAFSLGVSRPELAKTLLGENAYGAYSRLIKDKTPGVPDELVPYLGKIKMYDGVNKKLKRFKHWKTEKQAEYVRSRTMGKPLNTHDRDKLVAAAIVDLFFKDRVKKIKL